MTSAVRHDRVGLCGSGPGSGTSAPSRGAFTLLDVTVSVLIVGIISAVAVPRFVDALHRHRVDAAAERIQADLTLARRLAISRSTLQSVQFEPSSARYTLPGLPDPHHVGQTYAVGLSDEPYRAAIISASLGGDGRVQFDRFGRPDSGGTITVQSGSFLQTVTIDPSTGRASIP